MRLNTTAEQTNYPTSETNRKGTQSDARGSLSLLELIALARDHLSESQRDWGIDTSGTDVTLCLITLLKRTGIFTMTTMRNQTINLKA